MPIILSQTTNRHNVTLHNLRSYCLSPRVLQSQSLNELIAIRHERSNDVITGSWRHAGVRCGSCRHVACIHSSKLGHCELAVCVRIEFRIESTLRQIIFFVLIGYTLERIRGIAHYALYKSSQAK